MSLTDWIVLAATLLTVIGYGLWKSGRSTNTSQFLMGNRSLPWYTIGLSVMATQASAITFLSAPGQAFDDGMRFVQFYFGLPLAMIVLCITFVPIFHRLKVYTAYEYLEQRFDLKTRVLTAFLFLVQRGLSTGITIYAPSAILSVILNLNIVVTTVFIGTLVILYTVYGGTKAVSYTQLLQMSIIFAGIFMAGVVVVQLLPANVGFINALQIAGKMGRMNVIDWHFDPASRYNVWSGLIGGFFLQLSYFGTDQSQVGRYLTGSSVGQSRMGLIMNGLIKIPMQFLILLIGILVFSFYQFKPAPLFFNSYAANEVRHSAGGAQYQQLEKQYAGLSAQKQQAAHQLVVALKQDNPAQINRAQQQLKAVNVLADTVRKQGVALIKQASKTADTDDTNYIFLNFVIHYLPRGLIGLLIAIVFLASMGSTASALNSLASATVIDVYKRMVNKEATDKQYLAASRLATLFWGVVCILMALYAGRLGNLLEAVNQMGSYIYGVILGVFVVAFYCKRIHANQVFTAALLAEVIVIVCGWLNLVAYLWFNAIGCIAVVVFAWILHLLRKHRHPVVEPGV